MNWYNPKKWLNLNTGIIVIGVIVALVFIGTIIVGLALWNVPLAKCLFPFLEISEEFPTKAIALFTAGATFGTLFLALTMIYTLKISKDKESKEKKEQLELEQRNRKERYLHEIIEWATGILKCGRIRGVPYEMRIARTMGKEKEAIMRAMISGIENDMIEIAARHTYLRYIVTTFKPTLQSAVENARLRIKQHSRVMNLVLDNKAKQRSIGRHREYLDAAAKLVIREAVEAVKML